MKRKLQTQLKNLEEEHGITQPLYYYDDHITVCLLIGNSKHARGVAVCSPLDVFEKKEGRNKALGRAMKALLSEQTTEYINPLHFHFPHTEAEHTANARIRHAAFTYGWKSAYQPTLTKMEHTLAGM